MQVCKIIGIIGGTIAGVAVGNYIGKKRLEREQESLKVMLDEHNRMIEDYTSFEKTRQENREKLDAELDSLADRLRELGAIVTDEKIDENGNPVINFHLV